MSFTDIKQYTEGDTDSTITGTAILWEDTSNTLVSVSSSKPLPVDIGSATVTVNIEGDYAEDSGHTTGDRGLFILAVRNDNDTALAGTDLDYIPLSTDSAGHLLTHDDADAVIDTVVGGSDSGIAMLAKHQEDQVHLTTADGDYDILTLDSIGSLHVNAEAHHVFDAMNATTGWSVINDDTDNLATTTKHVTGTNAITFDKVNGAGNTTFCGIEKTLSSVDLGAVSQHDLLQGTFYFPDLTNVEYLWLRVGTDSSNYNEWRLPDTALTAGIFETGAQAIGDASYDGITGNGWDPSAITYIAIGVKFDNQTDTLAGLIFDEISYHTNQHTAAILGAEVTSEVSTPNINLQKIGGSTVDKGQGNASNGSQRVVIADDDTNMAGILADTAAIQTAVEIMDDWDESNRAAVNLIASQVGITGGAGAVAANTPRVTLASDDPAVSYLATIAGDTTSLDGKDFATQTTLAAILADTAAIQTAVETIDNAISGSEMQVDIVADGADLLTNTTFNAAFGTAGTADTQVLSVQGIASMTALVVDGSAVTQPVSGTVTANLSATDNAVLDNIETAVELIDDAVYADDADWTDGSSKHVLTGGLYQSSPQSITDGDVGPIQVDSNGNQVTTTARKSLTGSAPTSSSVAATSGSALASNSSRKGAYFKNVSNAVISLGVGQTAVLNDGITLYPGDAWMMDEFSFSTAQINAIAGVASSDLAIQEWT